MSQVRKRSHHRGGSRGRVQGVPPLPRDDLRFSNTTGILPKKKKTMWFIDVAVEQETSAPPPKKNPGSASASCSIFRLCGLCPHLEKMMLLIGTLKLVRCSLLVVIWLVAKPKLLLQKKKKWVDRGDEVGLLNRATSTDVVTKSRTTLYFLQQMFATIKNQIRDPRQTIMPPEHYFWSCKQQGSTSENC